jgi:hypothetical protein
MKLVIEQEQTDDEQYLVLELSGTTGMNKSEILSYLDIAKQQVEREFADGFTAGMRLYTLLRKLVWIDVLAD